jgi:hypothetical protein
MSFENLEQLVSKLWLTVSDRGFQALLARVHTYLTKTILSSFFQ